IVTFNRDKERVRLAVETLTRYLDNIIANPDEEKFKKIRLENKVYKDRLAGLDGPLEFLQAAGFQLTSLPVSAATGDSSTADPADNEKESYLIFTSPPPHELEVEEEVDAGRDASGVVHPTGRWLSHLRHRLKTGGAPVFALDRGVTVYRVSGAGAAALAGRFKLPDDFYRLTAEEVKREQMRRTEEVDKASVLRTRAMREREGDSERPPRQYHYCLLRVRTPDGLLLQGTFSVSEPACRVHDFVRSCLTQEWVPFSLLGPRGIPLPNEEAIPLSRTGLVPAALLTLVWDPDVHADILAASSPSPPSSQPPSSSSSSPSPSSSSSPSSSTCPPCCLKAELMAACLTLS
ncbi:UBX domain-containing protein 6, partial [Lampetra fluviatilis]